jgi:hypothetical protein
VQGVLAYSLGFCSGRPHNQHHLGSIYKPAWVFSRGFLTFQSPGNRSRRSHTIPPVATDLAAYTTSNESNPLQHRGHPLADRWCHRCLLFPAVQLHLLVQTAARPWPFPGLRLKSLECPKHCPRAHVAGAREAASKVRPSGADRPQLCSHR